MKNTSHVLAGVSLDAPVIEKLAIGNAAFFTRKAPYKQNDIEDPNQDSVAVIAIDDNAVVLAVADGMGGAPSGDVASRVAIQSLVDSLQDLDGNDLRDVVLNGIEKANKAILRLENGAATTLAVVEVIGNRLRSYHIGDSGIVVTGQRGRLRLQTTAHSPTGYAVEAGLIEEAEALAHTDRNVVSNVVGSHDLRIEIGPPIRLSPRDTVIIASDGLFDNMLTSELIEIVRCGDLKENASTLVDLCGKRMEGHVPGVGSGHPDDLSFILYRP